VWGPPGTGKTQVLARAITDLVDAGKRVLLVSSTNIAVDTALLKVIQARRHASGDLVRVGPPHLREVAQDDDVALPGWLPPVSERSRNSAKPSNGNYWNCDPDSSVSGNSIPHYLATTILPIFVL
jgi:hypothetical protein